MLRIFMTHLSTVTLISYNVVHTTTLVTDMNVSELYISHRGTQINVNSIIFQSHHPTALSELKHITLEQIPGHIFIS